MQIILPSWHQTIAKNYTTGISNYIAQSNNNKTNQRKQPSILSYLLKYDSKKELLCQKTL